MQINCLSNLKKTTVIAHSSMIPVSKNIFIHYNANKANNILTPDQKMYIGISLTKTVHYTDMQLYKFLCFKESAEMSHLP